MGIFQYDISKLNEKPEILLAEKLQKLFSKVKISPCERFISFAGEALLIVSRDKFFELGNIDGKYSDLHVSSDFIFAKSKEDGWTVVNLLVGPSSTTVKSVQLTIPYQDVDFVLADAYSAYVVGINTENNKLYNMVTGKAYPLLTNETDYELANKNGHHL